MLIGLGMLRLAQQQHGPASQHSGAHNCCCLQSMPVPRVRDSLMGHVLVGRTVEEFAPAFA